MRIIITLFWSFLLGQIVGYIGGALSNASYNFELTTAVSLTAGIIFLLISYFSTPKKSKNKA